MPDAKSQVNSAPCGFLVELADNKVKHFPLDAKSFPAPSYIQIDIDDRFLPYFLCNMFSKAILS